MRRLPLMPAAYTVSQPSASVPSRPRSEAAPFSWSVGELGGLGVIADNLLNISRVMAAARGVIPPRPIPLTSHFPAGGPPGGFCCFMAPAQIPGAIGRRHAFCAGK